MVYYAGLTRAYATVLAHIDPRQVPLESLFLALNGMYAPSLVFFATRNVVLCDPR